ncbi:MAG: hypothetical protein EOP09_14350 [Proteobacteria bacterium]|nr:MAG: hypothetical protein EOP09_14350 [Pseudomonadota bacterium]
MSGPQVKTQFEFPSFGNNWGAVYFRFSPAFEKLTRFRSDSYEYALGGGIEMPSSTPTGKSLFVHAEYSKLAAVIEDLIFIKSSSMAIVFGLKW